MDLIISLCSAKFRDQTAVCSDQTQLVSGKGTRLCFDPRRLRQTVNRAGRLSNMDSREFNLKNRIFLTLKALKRSGIRFHI